MFEPDLIERIYEAAATAALWPALLDDLAASLGVFGMCFVHRGPKHAGWVIGDRMEEFAADYISQGWLDRDDRVPPVIAEQFPGFRVDADYRSHSEVRELPIYRDFLLPRGLQASAACALQGTSQDALHIGVEGLQSYSGARATVPALNALRPHLARAVGLTAKLSVTRAEASVAALQLAGVGAAVISPDRRIRAVNDRFAQRLGVQITTENGRIRFADATGDKSFSVALADATGSATSRSLALSGTAEAPPIAMHLLPLRRSAMDVLGWDGVLAMLAEPFNASVPHADLLKLLFDLTPTEARLTRRLLEGASLSAAATNLAISLHTARVHLRNIFAKTGVSRQTDLMRLLLGTGAAADKTS